MKGGNDKGIKRMAKCSTFQASLVFGTRLGNDHRSYFMHRFEELDVWKVSTGLSTDIYRTLSSLRDFSFRDQISRSGLSIPSNIAEGYERESKREIVRFLKYAKGSAGELRTQIYIGMNAGYINKETGSKWLDEALRISAMTSAMIRKFKSLQEP